MNIPLHWLAEYVKLPKSVSELTDKLTMIGHMLDKRTEVGNDVVIDLELRGNRSDLFSIIGIAREVSAVWNTPLTLPPTKNLPKIDAKSDLVTVDAADLVERFFAFPLTVKVGPSPTWMVKKLAQYGITSINNVVDITNYVMVETGEPMHAYDMDKLTGERLILRRAKKGEQMKALQGTTLTFTTEDLVIADEKQPQGTALIGGYDSMITGETTRIVLEAAVYHQANVRRTARRLGVRTDAGNLHEKHLDPNQVPIALARAYQLLAEHAAAVFTGPACDVYIKKRKPVTISVDMQDIPRLTGTQVPEKQAEDYLVRLGFEINKGKSQWTVIAPTFRTDIEQSADVIEEIIRLYGYDQIPVKTLSGQLPEPNTYPMVRLTEQVRDALVALQMNEVITTPIIDNKLAAVYEKHRKFPTMVTLVNAPDEESATLRPSLIPNLVSYARRSVGFRQERLAFFEIGKTYKQGKKPKYTESTALGILIAGQEPRTMWRKEGRLFTVYDLKGAIEGLMENLGIPVRFTRISKHPSMDPVEQGTILTEKGEHLGPYGTLDSTIGQKEGVTIPLFVAEISLDAIEKTQKIDVQPYIIAPQYPPILEDITFVVSAEVAFGDVLSILRRVDKHIASIELIDVYNANHTVRITYADPKKTLTNEIIAPVREKLINVAQEKFGLTVQTS